MFKKSLSVLLVLIMLFSVFSVLPTTAAQTDGIAVAAQEYTSGDYKYTVQDSKATLTKYSGSATNLTIPSVIEGYPVTKIGNLAFDGCSNLQTVKIPASVITIGVSAFAKTNLFHIEIPSSVEFIGTDAFYGCPLSRIIVDADNAVFDSRNNCNAIIETATNTLIVGCMYSSIPDTVTSIGENAFHVCNGLTEIDIPDSVMSIGPFAFAGCNGLTEIDIPDSVTSIDTYAFAGCESLTKVKLSASLTTIAPYLFNRCSALTEIVIPETVTQIRRDAFGYCVGLTEIDLPDSVTFIGMQAFSSCESLSQIKVSDTSALNEIGYYAFGNTAWLANQPNGFVYLGRVLYSYKGTCPSVVNIKKGTLGIAATAFARQSELTAVNMPDTVATIGEGAFAGCGKLSQISFHDTLKKVKSGAFSGTAWYNNQPDGLLYIGTIAYQYKTDRYTPAYPSVLEIAHGTTYISSDFCYTSITYDTTNITQVIIPDTVTEIGENAFLGSANLKDVTFPASVTAIGDYAFGYHKMQSYQYPIEDFVVRGYAGTEAERYAKDNGFVFVDLSEQPTEPITEPSQPATQPTITPTEPATQPTITPTEPATINIADCTVTLSQSTYTYDGGAKKPTVTVKNGSKTLTNGTDYSVEYKNNTNVGTATVTVSGKGSYTGTISKMFTIDKMNLSGCTMTLSQSTYTYDGSAKQPSVTVKNGSKTLTNGTDYSVEYKNNTNVGTATVTVTGKGNYTGTVSNTFSITEAKAEFKWGSDNWNFNNSAPDYYPYTTYRMQINSSYLDVLKRNLTNSEYQIIFNGYAYGNAWLDDYWGGSCYGMSSTTLLAKKGLLPYKNYKSGATKLSDLSYPKTDSNVSSLITYYQMLQVKDVIQQQYRTVPRRSHETNIKAILSALNLNPTVLVGFQKDGWGGHAILATGYEYGSWTWNGVAYQGCIKICDPNASTEYDKRANIYFNTSTYNWCIPLYSNYNMTSSKGAVFNYIGANVSEINQGGYLSGTSGNKTDGFVARIDAHEIAPNRSVSKVIESNGMYINHASAPGDIVEDYAYVLGNESKGVIGYNLYDASAAYQVKQDDAQELELTMDYESCNLSGCSMAGKSVLFDPVGYVEVKGESATYSMSMTFDEEHPTDWFNIEVTGSGANTASLRKVDEGFVITADVLKNVQISCNNCDFSTSASFSTIYDSAMIYEVDEHTIGVKVDTDGNGSYETVLRQIGDADGNGRVNINDVTSIQRHLADLDIFTEEQLAVADVNGDGKVDINDATHLQRYLAEFNVKLG